MYPRRYSRRPSRYSRGMPLAKRMRFNRVKRYASSYSSSNPRRPGIMRGPSATEVKCYDFQVTPGTNPVVDSANLVGSPSMGQGMCAINTKVLQGATFNQRIGAKIVINAIQLVATFVPDSTAPIQGCHCRSLIIYDNAPNGAYATLDDILAVNGASAAGSFTIPFNILYKDRFTIIRDRYFPLNPMDSAGGQYTLKEFVKGRWETNYHASTGQIGDINTGAIYWMVFADTPTDGSHACSINNAVFRIRYLD